MRPSCDCITAELTYVPGASSENIGYISTNINALSVLSKNSSVTVVWHNYLIFNCSTFAFSSAFSASRALILSS